MNRPVRIETKGAEKMSTHNLLFTIRGYIFLIALWLYLVHLFFPFEALVTTLNIITALLVLTAYIGASKFYTVMMLLFLFSSVLLVELRGVAYHQLLDGF